MLEDWDPNELDLNWPSYVHSTNSEHRALVDYEDWLFVCRWQWRFKPSKRQGMGGKDYLCRSAWVYPVDAPKFNTSLWLHVEIMRRVEPPPSMFHTQVDHIDRNRMNCTRANLKWATVQENNKNKALPARGAFGWVAGPRKETP